VHPQPLVRERDVVGDRCAVATEDQPGVELRVSRIDAT